MIIWPVHWRLDGSYSVQLLIWLYAGSLIHPPLPMAKTGGKQAANKCFKHALRVMRNPTAADRRTSAIHDVWEIMRENWGTEWCVCMCLCNERHNFVKKLFTPKKYGDFIQFNENISDFFLCTRHCFRLGTQISVSTKIIYHRSPRAPEHLIVLFHSTHNDMKSQVNRGLNHFIN